MVTAKESLEAAAPEWEELAVRQSAAPFLRPGWILAWRNAFGGPGVEARTVRRDGELKGVIPVRSSGGVVRSPTNWHTPLFGPVVDDSAAADELFASLVSERPRRVDLSFLSRDAMETHRLHGLEGYRVTSRPVLASPYLDVGEDWEPYWRSRSKNLRGTVRRCRNRLEEMGQVELEVLDGSEALEARLEEGFSLEATGWKSDRGTAVVSSDRVKGFYWEVASWAAARGMLRLAFLRVGGRAVAFNYCIESHGAHHLVKLGHDAELARAGPGTVLTALMVERAFDLGQRSYEFLGVAEPYKLRWATGCRDRQRVQAFAYTPIGLADRLVQTRGRAAATWIRARIGRGP